MQLSLEQQRPQIKGEARLAQTGERPAAETRRVRDLQAADTQPGSGRYAHFHRSVEANWPANVLREGLRNAAPKECRIDGQADESDVEHQRNDAKHQSRKGPRRPADQAVQAPAWDLPGGLFGEWFSHAGLNQ